MAFLFSRPKSQQPINHIEPTGSRKWRHYIWGIVILFVGVVGWIGITGALALKNITAKNTSDAPSFFKSGGVITPDSLQSEGDSRINILFIGIGGVGHKGGQLADTIQVASIDPINKTMGMLSIPRDLYVTQATGERSKINAVYANGATYCKLKSCPAGVDQGGAALKDTVSNTLGVPIHYFARIDFNGFKKIVDTLGGVQVYVDKPLSDPYFPDSELEGYEPLYIPAGLQKFNGTLALKYARSRESTSDFDRARRQQQLIAAIREKALSLNVLGNPKKVTDLITTLGVSLRTDMKIDEMLKVVTLVKELDSDKTVTKVLDTSADGPLKSMTDPKAGYIILPKKGLNDYSELREFADSVFQEPYIIREQATVAIVNASGDPTVATTLQSKLTKLGYNVISATNSSTTQAQTTVTNNSDKPYTTALLKKRFIATLSKTKSVGSDITLTVGTKYLTK